MSLFAQQPCILRTAVSHDLIPESPMPIPLGPPLTQHVSNQIGNVHVSMSCEVIVRYKNIRLD